MKSFQQTNMYIFDKILYYIGFPVLPVGPIENASMETRCYSHPLFNKSPVCSCGNPYKIENNFTVTAKSWQVGWEKTYALEYM